MVTGLLLAACGSSGSKKNASVTATSAAGGTTTTPHFSGSRSSNFCDLARTAQAAAQTTGSSIDKLKASIQQFNSVKDKLHSDAPGVIKNDVVVVVGAVEQLFTALQNANYDYTKLSPNQIQALNSPSVQASERRVAAYLTQVCGVGTTTTTG
jgi:hypothetical protein